jgi:hypothetical protein
VNSNGNYNNNNCSNSYGVRPASMDREMSNPQWGENGAAIIKGSYILSAA